MTEHVSIQEAAERLGVSADTVRRRLKRGELTGEKEETPQGFVWRVELPGKGQMSPPAIEATPAAQAASVLMEDALEAERLRERVTGLERLVGELEGEREAWKAQAERHEEAARELRILVQQAQVLAQALPATVDNPEPQSGARPRSDATLSPKQNLWQRLRDRLGRV